MGEPQRHPQEADRAVAFCLAEMLGMTVREVLEMDAREFMEWGEYLAAKHYMRARAQEKAEREAKMRRRR